ncbi:MAG: TetR/AcrR family transcriptional regulator [Halieaceae bacterium]|jgi:AcrR family transcriptional regulator|nr:TetR/AcrR family transcriptional regulator [Halieaceae bacterium]
MSSLEPILNAAKACYLRMGVAKTTAADIACEAGISRATLYRRFPSHNDIFQAVLARDSWEMIEACEKALLGIDDPAEHVIEGILYVLDEIVRRPLHAHLFSESNGSWALSQTMAAENLHDMCVQMLLAMPGLRAGSDPTTETRIAFMGEWILRILTSYAIVPSHIARNRDEMRELLYTTLEPAIRALFVSADLKQANVKSIR